MSENEANITKQRAGDSGTQIGSIGGNLIQHVYQKRGFWGSLPGVLIIIGVLAVIGALIDDGSGSPSQTASMGGADGTDAPAFVFGPSGGGDRPTPAQLAAACTPFLQNAIVAQAQAIFSHDVRLASTAYGGMALQSLQYYINQLAAAGCTEQRSVERCNILGARPCVGSTGGEALQLDVCVVWVRTTRNAWGQYIAPAERLVQPQAVTIEIVDGAPLITAVDYAVSFPGCY